MFTGKKGECSLDSGLVNPLGLQFKHTNSKQSSYQIVKDKPSDRIKRNLDLAQDENPIKKENIVDNALTLVNTLKYLNVSFY